MLGHTIHAAAPAHADLFEAIWDIDIPDVSDVRLMHVDVLPIVAPVLCLHYRAPIMSGRPEDAGIRLATVTGARTRAFKLYPTGPVGTVAIRLRPSAAARMLRGAMAEITDGHVDLADVLSPSKVSVIADQLAHAEGAEARHALLARFVATHVGGNTADPLVDAAVARLRREPALPMHRLAATMEISERQLERRFRADIGLSPKKFARVARCERILAARGRGHAWADIAADCGFADQAHMVRDFKSMVGAAPDAFARLAFAPERRGVNGSLAMSGFFNTFVM